MIFFSHIYASLTAPFFYPENLKKIAPLYFIPYGINQIENDHYHYEHPVYHLCERIIVDHPDREKKFPSEIQDKVLKTGLPLFDTLSLQQPLTQQPKCQRILWTPHWTSFLPLNEDYLFSVMNMFIALAKQHAHIRVTIRLHPMYLSRASGSLLEKIQTILHSHSPIFKINNTIPYTKVFQDSDLLVCDSISFLAEYTATGKPLIYLQKPDQYPLDEVGKYFGQHHLVAHTVEALRSFLEQAIDGTLFYNAKGARQLFEDYVKASPPSSAEAIKKELLEKFQAKVKSIA